MEFLPAQDKEAPDDLPRRAIELNALASEWVRHEVDTQRRGNPRLDSIAEALLVVPSVVVPLSNAPDRNVLIRHRHPDVPRIRILRIVSFELERRLFQP
jgi:RES domain-containing protein